MATLNGKKITERQHAALKKKWAKDDKKFWLEKYRKEIKLLQDQVKQWKRRAAETKKKLGKPYGIQLNAIKSRESEIKALRIKIKNL